MQKKKGKVVASLTEVKNKTGDIFALVDEYGEVILTSYNKPRYRISKISIEETLDIKEVEDEVLDGSKSIKKENFNVKENANKLPRFENISFEFFEFAYEKDIVKNFIEPLN